MSLRKKRRLFVPANAIPDMVKEAFISAEDKNFYSHDGYDLRGIGAAAFEAVRSRGKDVRGCVYNNPTGNEKTSYYLATDKLNER